MSGSSDPYGGQTDPMGNPLPTMSNSDGTPMPDPLTSQGRTAAGAIPDYLSWAWGLTARAVLLAVGFIFIFIAVIALLWQSKTVRVVSSKLTA
jgi:hypothetical protein